MSSTGNKLKLKVKLSKPGSTASNATVTNTTVTEPVPQELPTSVNTVTPPEINHNVNVANGNSTDDITVKRETIDITDDDPSATTTSAQTASALPTTTTQPPALPITTSNVTNAAPTINLKDQKDVTLKGGKRPSSVLDYIIQLGGATLDHLYTDLFTSLTIFRSLPALAKQYVLRLLLIDLPVNQLILQSWCKTDAQTQQAHRLSMHRLRELRILQEVKVENDGKDDILKKKSDIKSDKKVVSNKEYRLNQNFQKCIKQALFTHISDPTIEAAPGAGGDISDAKPLSVEQLTTYANNKWESMLHFMVGASTGANLVSLDVQQRLVAMGLMTLQTTATGTGKNYQKTEQFVITSVGFNFLFKDQATQVWDLILAYIDTLSDGNINTYDVLQFLFRLSFLRVGHRYDATALTDAQRKLLVDLQSFGLIFMNKPTSKRYSPTPLALTLSNTPAVQSAQQQAANQTANGFIIVETTFKVYAFTTSPFHIKLLSLFCRLDYRLPNMVVGTITKQSIRHALKNNITSNEIVNYLDAYAHPQMRVQMPVLPPTVVDQIRLWEHERDRLNRVEATLFDEFDISTNEFQQTIGEVRRYDPKLILVVNDQKKLLVLAPAGLEIVKQWRERQKAAAAAAAANG